MKKQNLCYKIFPLSQRTIILLFVSIMFIMFVIWGTFVINQDESVDAPCIINPTPVNIVDEYQEEGNAAVKYDPNNNKTTIAKGDESDAKKN